MKKVFCGYFKKFVFSFLLCFFCGTGFLYAEDEITTITITNARETSYKKADGTGNDTIELEGKVELSVKKGSTTSEIKADRITYDRQTEMLYAEGNVSITTKGGSSGNDTTTASSFLLNTSTLEGVFDEGRVVQTQSDAINLPSGSTLIVFSDMFGKGASNTIVFKNSSLTFCDDLDPHWHIDATRTWLLPGGEFAFFNALLYVGNIPVLYLPAFYYPKDELIFNPVFGYRKREGYFVQNTVYVFGRKPLDNSSSSSSTTKKDEDTSSSAEALKGLYNFMKPTSLKQQVREGLVLHNLDEDYKGDTSKYLKVMGDWYSTLGMMAGVEGKFAPNSYITALNFKALLGFSNTIFPEGARYLPFSVSSGKSYSDNSNFLGVKMPFRYGLDFGFSLAKPFSFTLSVPVFSDPFFQYDFMTNRQESMDWISYLLDSTSSDNETVTVSEYSSLSWNIKTSYSAKLPQIIKPYLNSLSMNMSSTVLFSSKTALPTSLNYKDEDSSDSDWRENTPERKFYFPSQITPLNFSASMSGTLFQYPFASRSSNTTQAVNYSISLNKPEEIKTIKELEADKKAKKEAEQKEEASENQLDKINEEQKNIEVQKSEEKKDEYKLTIPAFDFTPSSVKEVAGVTLNMAYNFNPSINTQLVYSSDSNYLKSADDFDWQNIKTSMYTIKLPVNLTNSFNYGGNFFSISNSFAYAPVFQKHPYLNTDDVTKGGISEAEAKTLKRTDYAAENQEVSTTNTVSFMPFAQISSFSETGVKWNTTIKLYRQEFVGTADEPEWKYHGPDWDDEKSVTVNSLSAILGVSQMDKKFKQNLTFTTIMPPLLRQYTAKLDLVFPYVTESISTGMQETTHNDVPYDEKWKKSNLNQSTTVSGKVLGNTLSFSQSYTYNRQEEYSESLRFSTSWAGLSMAYAMSYTTGYDFVEEGSKKTWKARSEKEFLPYSFTFSYTMPSKTYYQWFNRISVAPGLSTNIVADLIKPTSSYFVFTPSMTFNINNFFKVKFSASTRNAVIYRYFQSMTGNEGRVPGEDNLFIDLFNSFRFDDEEKRKSSGFKLKTMNIEVTHDLHDWNFGMTYSFSPKLVTENGQSHYDFNPCVTIGVTWNPMESMKTQIKDDYGTWSFK